MNGLQVCSVVFQSILIKSNKFNCLDYKDWQIHWFSEVIEFVVNYESTVNNFFFNLVFQSPFKGGCFSKKGKGYLRM